jgi:hypothetical protein
MEYAYIHQEYACIQDYIQFFILKHKQEYPCIPDHIHWVCTHTSYTEYVHVFYTVSMYTSFILWVCRHTTKQVRFVRYSHANYLLCWLPSVQKTLDWNLHELTLLKYGYILRKNRVYLHTYTYKRGNSICAYLFNYACLIFLLYDPYIHVQHIAKGEYFIHIFFAPTIYIQAVLVYTCFEDRVYMNTLGGWVYVYTCLTNEYMYIPFRKGALHTRPYMTGEMVFFSYSLEAYGLELVSIYVYLPKEYGHIVSWEYEYIHVYNEYSLHPKL